MNGEDEQVAICSWELSSISCINQISQETNDIQSMFVYRPRCCFMIIVAFVDHRIGTLVTRPKAGVSLEL